MSVSTALPDDATALALVVQDNTQPPERRNAALAKLDRLVIQRITNDLAPDCDEFHTEAITFVWKQLEIKKKFEPNRGKFESWCSTVLHHFLVDYLRKRFRRPASRSRDLPEEIEDRSGASSEFGEELCHRMHRLRKTLDRISLHFNATPRGVDYFAVLLLQLRLAISRRLLSQQAELDLLPEKVADLIALFLPWRPAEESRSFHRGWPMVQEVWEAVGEVLNRPPYRIEAPELCALLTRLNAGSPGITVDVWNQWVRRAKVQTRACVDSNTWEDQFAGFLPDYRPRLSSSCKGETP